MKNKIYSWKENPASSNTWIWANYSELKETTDNSWKLVKVCKRRCCVNFLGNTMILPLYWRQASLKDIEKAEKELSSIKEIDFFNLI
jgi:hypothetical protein